MEEQIEIKEGTNTATGGEKVEAKETSKIKTFTEEDVASLVKQQIEDDRRAQAEAFQGKLQEQLEKVQQQWEEKYTNLKDKYVSEESKKKLEEEEARAKAEREKAEREQAIKAEKEKLEQEKLALEVQKQSFIRLEVADELNVPKNLRKYITGKTKEEMVASAQVILEDMTNTKEEFDKAVQEAVEKKFANEATGFKKSTGAPKLTLADFQKMTTEEKLELMDSRKEEFDRLLSEKREQSQY